MAATWVVPWLKRLAGGLCTHEPGLALPMRASDYARRQLRFTPFPTEPLSWMFERAGADLFLFSSDYPHIGGGRNPPKRFESTMQGVSEEIKERFYATNFANLMVLIWRQAC
jgi:hypothetical protein